ncbi:MAG: prepilin-type N-terminal cleavage/methylation domain-containing protein [Planctomycetota bacterium]|jgi:prepilin-type N-terminal cleavage/methylation domain-containing protein
MPTARHYHKRSAFTLVELLLVLMIIGSVSAIAAPRFGTMIQNQRMEAAARRIAMDMKYAQREAKLTGISRTLLFSVADDSYGISNVNNMDHKSEPYIVDFKSSPYKTAIIGAAFNGDAALIFDGYGVPDSGGGVFLKLGNRQMTIHYDGTTEKVVTFEGQVAVAAGPVPE